MKTHDSGLLLSIGDIALFAWQSGGERVQAIFHYPFQPWPGVRVLTLERLRKLAVKNDFPVMFLHHGTEKSTGVLNPGDGIGPQPPENVR